MRRAFSPTRQELAAMLALVLAAPACAQQLQTPPTPAPSAQGVPPPEDDQEVTFSADTLDYDDQTDIVTAGGDVRMLRDGNRLRADKVVWNRRTGEVRAVGHVAIVNPGGDTAYGDDVRLTDTLKDGVARNMLLVLENGGRLAARQGTRTDGRTVLDHAAYTPCAVVDGAGCPKEPTWKITAVRVVHDPVRHRIFYKDARINFLGTPVLWLPAFSHPDGQSATGGGSGLLVPDIQYNRRNGLEVALPYYLRLGPNRDLTVTPHLFTGASPLLEGHYRQLTSTGAWQARVLGTYGNRLSGSTASTVGTLDRGRDLRGYLDVNGRFQPSPDWTLSGAVRAVSDRTFLRRYGFSYEDRLRSNLQAERITRDSYLSIAGWAVQTLRLGDSQKQQPLALPAIDYRRRIVDPLFGGVIQLQANSLALFRNEGQDTQRAFGGVRWDLRRYTPLGQELTLTAYGRADVYHTSDIDETPTLVYRGRPGWNGRLIGALAADMRWPLVGELLGGVQRIVPRVQLVATPPTGNLRIPNEDARAVDLEDSNLFALNRFAGYDRWEDASRVTYGGEWRLDVPEVSVDAVIGQSYRLWSNRRIFPDGTGLSGRFSDVVGRVTVRYGRFIQLTERFRLDKDNLAVRRNEIDATVGSSRTYVTLGYLRLNRDIDTAIEDLRDREEVRLGARVQFARYWSVFGSTIIDLTGRGEDPTSLSDGYEPVRHRLGIQYDDDCIQLGVTWRRDYDPVGDARRGSTISLRLALKNVGR